MTYAVEERLHQGISHLRIKEAVAIMRTWIAQTSCDELADEVSLSVQLNNQLSTVTNGENTGIQEQDALDDLIEQAWGLSSAVIYGEDVDAEKFTSLLEGVSHVFANSPERLRTQFQSDYAQLLAHAKSARQVLSGERPPEKFDTTMMDADDEDVFTDKNKVGSPSWWWWIGVYQFLEEQRPSQANYDAKHTSAIEWFANTAPIYLLHNHIERDPHEVVCLPNDSPELAPFYDLDQSVSPFPEDDWYTEFLRLDWDERPSDKSIEAYAAELSGEGTSMRDIITGRMSD